MRARPALLPSLLLTGCIGVLSGCSPTTSGPPATTETTAPPTTTTETTAPPTTAATTSSSSRALPPSTVLIADVTWTGTELVVSPTAALRDLGAAADLTDADQLAAPPGWDRVLDAVAPGTTDAELRERLDTPGMRGQYLCHLALARGKKTWDLEPDRPAVDAATLVASGCNP